MNNFKNTLMKHPLTIFILCAIIPLWINFHWWPLYQVAGFLTPGSHEAWLGFWGGYLSILPSGLLTIYLFRKQSDFEQQRIVNDNIIEYQYLLKRLNSKMISFNKSVVNVARKSKKESDQKLLIDKLEEFDKSVGIIFQDLVKFRFAEKQNNIKDRSFGIENSYNTCVLPNIYKLESFGYDSNYVEPENIQKYIQNLYDSIFYLTDSERAEKLGITMSGNHEIKHSITNEIKNIVEIG